MSSLLGFLEYTKIMIERYQDDNANAIDMTLGKGNDTLFLSSFFKKVYSFDIQSEAIAISNDRLKNINNIELIHDSHVNFDKYITDNVSVVVYNLGYLPGYNLDITTLADSTIESLDKVLLFLNKKGLVILTIYPGHLKGAQESEELEKYISLLDSSKFHVTKYLAPNLLSAAYVVCIHKKY